MTASPVRQAAPEPPQTSKLDPDSERLVEAAGLIGQRLVKAALWDGELCTWEVSTNDRVDPWARKRVLERAGGALYQGSAGIGLFLAELSGVLGDERFRRTINGALLYAESVMKSRPVGFSLHSGLTGLAYVYARCAELFNDATAAEKAITLLHPLRGAESREHGNDVIGGPAGAIPILLRLATTLHEPFLSECAVNLGLHLIGQRRQWPVGWSWISAGSSTYRDLNGLAHGAAGIGAAFVELFGATSESAFRFAAEQAFAYEGLSFDAGQKNWPDFRNSELSEAISTPARREMLQASLRKGAVPPRYQRHFMNAWCHGAAGIGLTRLRAFELLGSLTYRAEAEQALEATLRHATVVRNYSLCHGVFGNDETLVVAARVFGDVSLYETARQRALKATDEFEFRDKSWPGGTIGAVADPSLMLGDAGVGYHLLRLANATVPSILLPTCSVQPPSSSLKLPVAESHLRVATWNSFFGRTHAVLKRLRPHLASRIEETVASLAPLDLRVIVSTLQGELEASDNKDGMQLIRDAMCLEMKRFELLVDPGDFSECVIEEIQRIPIAILDWDAVRFHLADGTAVVAETHDWDGWLRGIHDSPAPSTARHGVHQLIRIRNGTSEIRRLAPAGAVVLTACATPNTFEQVVDDVAKDVEGVSREDLMPIVRQQIARWYSDGTLIAEPLQQAF